MSDAGTAVARAFREERAAVLATLIRQLGDFTLAEDALQDAFATAVATWPRDGVPQRPGAWITTTARRKAIDRLRRDRGLADRVARLAAEEPRFDEEDLTEFGDDRLRLIFTCCHPALAPAARVALTLRMLGGLTTEEIARALLVSDAATYARITRAKHKIAAAGIPYRVPAGPDLPERLGGVLAVLYLIFNEGWSASGGDRLVRGELCGEAIRLARLLRALMPDEPEVAGLLALMLLHDSRRAARVDATGALVTLDRQDRALWDPGRIREGLRLVEPAFALGAPGPYALQAAIAALHASAPSVAETDWAQVAALYGVLARVAPSPVVEVNRAVALGRAHGPDAGLAVLEPVLAGGALEAYAPLHAAHGDLLERAGSPAEAAAAFARAAACADNAVAATELARRADALSR